MKKRLHFVLLGLLIAGMFFGCLNPGALEQSFIKEITASIIVFLPRLGNDYEDQHRR